jgi:anthranilate/para-aminobenzoate synthase component II
VRTVRNDRATVDELLARLRALRRLAGAVHARQAGISLEAVRRCPRRASRRSACASATRRWRRRSAGKVVRHEPVHGKTTTIEHDGRTIFRGLPRR